MDSGSYEAGICYFGFEDKNLDGIGKVNGSTFLVSYGCPLDNHSSVDKKSHEFQWENKEKSDDQVNSNIILD